MATVCDLCGGKTPCACEEHYSDDPEDDESDGLVDNCPNCGREYDEIDHEFQICSYCKGIKRAFDI